MSLIRTAVEQFIVTLILIAIFAYHPAAKAEPVCMGKALENIRAADPIAYRDMLILEGRQVMAGFVDCKEADLSIPSAFHEGVHGLTNDSYPLSDGRRLPHYDDVKFEPREVVSMLPAGKFETFGNYRDIYLLGNATAKERYGVLLDEFNAYSRELLLTAKMVQKNLPDQNQSGRDGVAAMMLIVKLTTERARIAHADDWARMQSPEHLNLIRSLWAQAETGLQATCANDSKGIDDVAILKAVYSDQNSAALSRLLGRRLENPSVCAAHLARNQAFGSSVDGSIQVETREITTTSSSEDEEDTSTYIPHVR